MNRLLQGDVGSGKTVVAAIACYAAVLNGCQSLIMAPTELLAEQHFKTLLSVFKNLRIKIDLMTSSHKIINSDSSMIVGTHALLYSKKINLKKVALVIIDEQHRFGVKQRSLLRKHGPHPHFLTMTATPIPRTVALVLSNELDISRLDEMPVGRLPVKTYIIPQDKRTAAYRWIKEQIAKYHTQVFIVCPFIEESSMETLKSIRAATDEFHRLRKEAFPGVTMALLHGKMKSREKDLVMEKFRKNEVSILVTTPLVEVGIDIPNATVMMIEGAERFGLAQLHQLRGRVGRGDKQSYCLLFTSSSNQSNSDRLRFFSKTHNGIELAEFDLKKRGPGEFFGVRQHGFNELKIASFLDFNLILQAKDVVKHFIQTRELLNNPIIERRIREYDIEYIAND